MAHRADPSSPSISGNVALLYPVVARLRGLFFVLHLQTMELKIKKLRPNAKVPARAHVGDAGFDLCAIESVTIHVGARVLIGTGIAMEIPDGYAGLVWDKSGLSNNHGLKTLGGVMDAGYRGEIKVGLVNLGDKDYTIEAGHKVAQVVIQKVEHMGIKEVAELSDTTRGHGGFGSTGK